MNHMNQMGHCRCVHHKVVPVLVILLGLTFLLGTLSYLPADIARLTWPTLIILIGIVKLCSGGCKCYMNSGS